ncbi:MAG: 23S rRNA pseudouridine(955/2504/2580) synthase RluC [Gammaproteobacteria bacterium]
MNNPLSKGQSGARIIEIDVERVGQRVDNFLASQLKGVPKSHIYRILRKGEVRVNGGRTRPEYRLQAGDKVRIPPIRLAESGEVRPLPGTVERLQSRILYEDGGLIVLNKPAGMAVHGGSGVSYGVIEALRTMRPEARHLELVHRLDRDTSGCLMVAKKRSVLRGLHELLRQGKVEKRYLVLLAGRWEGGLREITAPLRKNVLQGGERIVRVSEEGKPAVSLFKPVTRFRQASLVEVMLATGRTHQIRVHAAHIGQPIAGDEKYGDAEFNRWMRKFGLKRLFLHAHFVAFRLPGTKEEVSVSAPLDDDLRLVLENLEDKDD